MDFKEKMKNCGVCQWEVAEALNVSEFTLIRWLRRPEKMEESKAKAIHEAIENLKNKKKLLF